MVRNPKKRPHKGLTSDRILTAALKIVESQGRARVRINQIATRIGVPLVDFRGLYHDMNAIANSWFAHRDAKTDCYLKWLAINWVIAWIIIDKECVTVYNLRVILDIDFIGLVSCVIAF